MLICAQCGEHNAADARFCGACNAFLEWDGARADEAPVATAVAEPAPATVAQPGEAGPAPVRHRSQTQAAPPRPPAPGDLICGQCGEGNAPTRRFCRRCGGSLADSLAVKPPWWRRFVPHRKDKRLQAGARRARRRGVFSESFRSAVRWVRNIVAIVVVLAAIGYALFPAFRHTVNTDATAARNKVVGMFVTHYDPVHPVTITANVSDPAHPADLIDDNTIGTYWAAPFNGPEPTLVLTFDHKVNLAKAIVRSGIGSDFQSADRPQTLHLVFSTGKTYDMNLADTPDPQDVSIGDSDGATSVEVHVTSRYHSLHGSEVAIDEFELFVKS